MRNKLTVRLPRENLDFLKDYAKQHGVTATEVIDRYLRRLRALSTDEVHPDVRKFSGLIPMEVDVKSSARERAVRKH